MFSSLAFGCGFTYEATQIVGSGVSVISGGHTDPKMEGSVIVIGKESVIDGMISCESLCAAEGTSISTDEGKVGKCVCTSNREIKCRRGAGTSVAVVRILITGLNNAVFSNASSCLSLNASLVCATDTTMLTVTAEDDFVGCSLKGTKYAGVRAGLCLCVNADIGADVISDAVVDVSRGASLSASFWSSKGTHTVTIMSTNVDVQGSLQLSVCCFEMFESRACANASVSVAEESDVSSSDSNIPSVGESLAYYTLYL